MSAGTAAPDLAQLPAHVQERWPLAVERARRKLAGVASNPAAWRLVQAAQRAPSARQRVVWLHRAADAWAAPQRPWRPAGKGATTAATPP